MGCGDTFNDVTDSLGVTQHGAKKAHKKNQKQLQALFAQLQGQQLGLFGQAQGSLQKALKAQQAGYGKAIANAGLGATTAKRSVLDREKQSMGGLTQSLADRGLYNTTLLDNAQRGISSSTNKQLSQIDAMTSQILSQLQVGQAGAEADIYGGLASLFQNQSGAMTGLGLNKAQMMYGAPFNQNTFAPGGAQTGLESLLAIFGGGF